MFENMYRQLRVLTARMSATWGVLFGVVFGVLLEAIKLAQDLHNRTRRLIKDLQEEIDTLKKAVGLLPGGTTPVPGGNGDMPGASFTVDIGSGATELFGSYFGTTSAAAGGVPMGPVLRSFTTLYGVLSSAMDGGTQIVVTPQYSLDMVTWTQIGTGTLTITSSSGTGPFWAALALTPVQLPAGAYIRFQAVATGDPGSRNYAFYLK